MTKPAPPAASLPRVFPWRGLLLVAAVTAVIAPIVLFGASWRFDVMPWWGPQQRDVLFAGAIVKALASGQYVPFMAMHSADIGFPFGFDGADWPVDSPLQVLLMEPFALFTSNPFVIMNLYLVLTYVMSAAAFYVLAVSVGARKELGFGLGIVFAFIPFHTMRSMHLFLTAHAVIPLAILLCFWLWKSEAIFAAGKRRWFVIATAFGLGVWHVYFSFFSCMFFVASGAGAAFTARKWRPFITAMMLCGITTFGCLVSVAPTLLYRAKNGPNPIAVERRPDEVEFYGLRLASILLPPPTHRLPPMAAMGARYEADQRFPIEGQQIEYIGLLAVLGLAVSLLAAWRHAPESGGTEWLIVFLVLVAALYATAGGGGSVFARMVMPLFRCLNRISVFIACLGLLGATLWLDRRFVRFDGGKLKLVIAGIVLVALFDQVPKIPTQSSADDPYFVDTRAFYEKMQAALPANTAVLQLPFQAFPEAGYTVRMHDYQHFEGYTLTHGLRFSYGAMKGREASSKIERLSQVPLDVAAVRQHYGAVMIDRRGFADQGAAAEQNLVQNGLQKIAESGNRYRVLYRLQ